jgi:hypothetical protein
MKMIFTLLSIIAVIATTATTETGMTVDQLTETQIHQLLEQRDECMQQGLAKELVELFTSNAIISISFMGISDASDTIDAQEFSELLEEDDVDFRSHKTEPQEINLAESGKKARVKSNVQWGYKDTGKRERTALWHVEETMTVALVDGSPKIEAKILAITGMTLEPD